MWRMEVHGDGEDDTKLNGRYTAHASPPDPCEANMCSQLVEKRE